MKVLHFADMHYDEKNFLEVQKCSDYIIKRAIDEKPDVIICSGDVTNSEYLGASTKSANGLMATFKRLSDVAPIAVVIGTPSHDGQTPELLRYCSGRYPIYVSTQPEQIFLVHSVGSVPRWVDKLSPLPDLEGIGLIVSQIPAPTKAHWKNRQGVEKDNENMADAMGAIFTGFGEIAKEFKDVPHILNGHFSMKGSKLTETQLLPGGDIAIGQETLAAANADLYCLGHIHMKQSYKILGKEICFHSGSTWRKNFGERNEDKGFYIHSIEMGGIVFGDDKENVVNSDFMKTPTREMVQGEFDLVKNYEDTLTTDLSKDISDTLIISAEQGAYIKIKIKLYMDDIRLLNQAKLKRTLLDAGASDVILEIDRVRRENSRDDEIIKAVSLPDKVEALANYRSEPAPDGVMEILGNVERLNETDLINYALSRI